MIVVRVELHSAITGRVTELARMIITNDGTGTGSIGHYMAATLRGRSREMLNRLVPQRSVRIGDWPRQRLHVWNLVGTALTAMGYGRDG